MDAPGFGAVLLFFAFSLGGTALARTARIARPETELCIETAV
jgi:hypothetical protein